MSQRYGLAIGDQPLVTGSLPLVWSFFAPFEAFKIGLVSPKTLFGQGSLGISRWSTMGTIGRVGCDVHYSHDGHYGCVSHDCHEAIKVIIDLRPSRLKKRKIK